jgi:hypothetical protein
MIDRRAKRSFDEQGYVVARGLFDVEETAFWRDHFTSLREAGSYPGDVVGADPSSDDPLKRYPRMIHMHRWDAVALDWMIEPRLAQSLRTLLGGLEPFAVQTMLSTRRSSPCSWSRATSSSSTARSFTAASRTGAAAFAARSSATSRPRPAGQARERIVCSARGV